MGRRSVCLVPCFASLLALTPATAQVQPQLAEAAAASVSQPVSDTAQGSVPRVIRFSGTLGAAEVKPGSLPPDELGIGEPRWLTVTPVGGQAQP